MCNYVNEMHQKLADEALALTLTQTAVAYQLDDDA